jgi:G6PDH family F420-dependent oxidoreductase
MAEEAGFAGLWISDHYHPWVDAQGESAFVWSVIGALSQVTERVPVTTAVTCPTLRIHPAVIAQAAATSAAMLPGRFRFGVGSGEALNEHILGDHWPEADVRLAMLEESIEIIRELWTGRQVSYDGNHYVVENARIYTVPDELPPILVSGFGPKSIDLAARIGDGYVLVGPSGDDVTRFREGGGGDKPVHSGTKVCWGADEAECVRTAHRVWPNEALPGELAQVLPTPAHFEQVTSLVTEEMIAESVVCGPDMDRHVEEMQAFADAGIDEVYVQQIGGDHEGFFAAYREHVLPRFHS